MLPKNQINQCLKEKICVPQNLINIISILLVGALTFNRLGNTLVDQQNENLKNPCSKCAIQMCLPFRSQE